jgi:Leucine-rich repeat (LRR) protein
LKNLDLGGTKIQTLDVIKNMPLVVLNLERVEIDDRDLSVLSEIGTLAHLNLSGTKITTISPIKKLRLQTLELGGCRSLNDFSSLSDMPLSRLGLSRDGISDLDILRGLPLTRLDISHTKVTSLEPLRGMALVSLNLRGTEVTDLTPLKGMPLRYVDCVGVTPNDWGPLAGMPIQDFYFSPQPRAILPLLRTLSDLRRINGRAWGAPQPAN